MTCHSGGTLDVFIEPVLPKPHVLILGRSPVARTLATLAKTIGYVVSVAAPGADREAFPGADSVQQGLDLGQFRITPQTFIVVSTQGESDEEALEAAINAGSGYIAFVASKTKATKTLDDLKDRGLPADKVAKVRAPAGLDIHASSPEEIAVSILAEIIQLQKMKGFEPRPTAGLPILAKTAKDPICGMTVDTISTNYMSEYAGVIYYFCCAGCKHTFAKDPQKYALPPTQ
jgi:xanthine dehydrogenase accessory factor